METSKQRAAVHLNACPPGGRQFMMHQPERMITTSPATHDSDLGHYTQLGVLGVGTFGRVVRAVHNTTGEEVAIKLLPRGNFSELYRRYVSREIKHQSSLRHPLIVALKEVFLTPSYLAIAMEYARGGDLFTYTLSHQPSGRLSEQQARWIFQQLMIGLDYCHQRGVANRDLKLENLLLDRDSQDGARPLLKICDFGYAKADTNSSANTAVGTPVYMAPEVIMAGKSKYDAKKADIWSCGIILYAMLFGKHPFDVEDRLFIRKLVLARYTVPADVPVSEDCLDILRRVLVANPSQRLNMDQIRAHRWFRGSLPPGALEMNKFLINGFGPMDEFCQEVDAIVDQAQVVSATDQSHWPSATPGVAR
ncbi:hypothetical protein WJX74_002218 [Apatococcus lobatus]|uniref:Protein kinase domain-containing protein n=2 Tax=Apatococcus TaxID=904362 RepID=A0AAW1SQX3_9CHLO